MPKKGEEFESAHWRIEVDEDDGRPRWTGGGSGDKEGSTFDPDEPLVMRADCFPPGTRVIVVEPWDEDFYERLSEQRRNPAAD